MTVHHGADILFSLASMANGATSGNIRAVTFVPDAPTQARMLNNLPNCVWWDGKLCLNVTVYNADATQSSYYAYAVAPAGVTPVAQYQYAILDTTSPSYTAVLVGPVHQV